MRFVKIVAALVFVGAVFGIGLYFGRRSGGGAPEAGSRKILYYVDPMHPAYKSDKPGIAPDCGMRLEPVYADEGPTTPQAKRKVLHYRDPRDHNYTADGPGLNPETGNELEPVYAEDPASMPGMLKVPVEKQQLIGVRYTAAEMESGTRTIRAVGKVEMDETRIARIHPKVDGWIEDVFVDFIGKFVRKGQPLLTIYSPELLATQQEFLLALKATEAMKHSSLSGATADSHSLVQAARRRLELWDLTDAQIDEIQRTGKPEKTVTLYSPISGYVTARNAFPKQRILPDTELYTVVDLSRVWVMADVFEYEAPSIRLGQAGTVTLPYESRRSLPARVNYIQPSLDPTTRTLKVRLDLGNPGLILKPEMFVDVEFRLVMPRRVTVPSGAVLDSGLRQTVFVDHGDGYLESRQVETGERRGDRIEIVKGLHAGERVVASGTFLIDSESQLKAASAGMAPGHNHSAAPSPEPAKRGGSGHD